MDLNLSFVLSTLLSRRWHHDTLLPTLYLMKLGQVGAVDSLVPENPVDAEVLGWPEALLGQLVQHPRGHSCRVSPQQVLLGLTLLPGRSVSGNSDTAFVIVMEQ